MELLNFWLEAPGDAARWLRGIIARRADYSPAEPRSVSPELISQTLSLGGAGLKSKGLAKPSKRAPKQRGHSNAAGGEKEPGDGSGSSRNWTPAQCELLMTLPCVGNVARLQCAPTHLPSAARPTLWVSAALGGMQAVLHVLYASFNCIFFTY